MFEDRIHNESYTIFALPFAYRPEAVQSLTAPGTLWREQGLDDQTVDLNAWETRHSRLKGIEEEAAPGRRFSEDYLHERSPVWRNQYLIPETNLILFQRARWFRLEESGGTDAGERLLDREFRLVLPDQASVALRVEWVRLVLFEFELPEARGTLPPSSMHNGVLLLKALFPEGAALKHLLWLNEALRYHRMPFWAHPKVHFNRAEVLPWLVRRHGSVLEQYGLPWEDLLRCPLRLQDGRDFVLFREEPLPGRTDVPGALARWRRCRGLDEGTWDVYPDNRCFVWTCAVLEGSGRSVPDFTEDWHPSMANPGPRDGFLMEWFNLLDVDRSETWLNPCRYRWLRDRTYTRWASGGTLYGFNNYSAALMTTDDWDVPLWHFETMYLDMLLMMLQVRTSLFRFSGRIGRLTARHRDRTLSPAEWRERFQELRDDFASFTNLFQFPLLSTQQQGIEMYAVLRQQMDVDALFREVESEIRATHEFAAMQHQQAVTELQTRLAQQQAELLRMQREEARQDAKLTQRVNVLATWGIGLAAAALVSQFFSMDSHDLLSPDPALLRQVFLAVLTGMGVSWFSQRWIRRRDKAASEEPSHDQ